MNKLQSAFAAVICRPPETGVTEPLEQVFVEVLLPLALCTPLVPVPTRQERFPGAARLAHGRSHTVLIPHFRRVIANAYAPSLIQLSRQRDSGSSIVLVRAIYGQIYLHTHMPYL